MKKISGKYFRVLACFFFSLKAIGQTTIEGPDCVLSGFEYQYNFKGNLPPDAKVCVSGGIISGNSSSCTKVLSPGYVRIVWNGSKGTVSFSSSSGNTTLQVSVTTALQPGNITTGKAEYISFKSACSIISCSKPIGGGCGATYSFQWQRSLNNLDWEDIPGAISQNLGGMPALTETYFYRRRVTEKVSQTVLYSDAAVVYVAPETKGN